MRGRQINPNFFNNDKPKNDVGLKAKFKAARASGTLNLSSSNPSLTVLPLEIFDLENHLEEGEKFWELVPLATLDLSTNKISTVPPNIGQLVDCTTLKLRSNLIDSLPDALYSGCVNLKHIDVDSNRLQEISDLIGHLRQLKDMIVSNNMLRSLPLSIFQLSSLRHLDLQGNQLQSLPDGMWNIDGLVYLNVSNNKIQRLPSFISSMRALETLFCHANNISVLPDLSQLTLLKFLNCTQNALSQFPILPRGINGKSKLVEFHVGYNRISTIDLDGLLAQSSSLSEFLIHNNQLTDLPAELELLSNLKILDVSNNGLKELPATLGWMGNLQRLKVDGNPLKTIRQLLLTKPSNEFKAYLRTRGPSLLQPSGSAANSAYDDGKGASIEDQIQFRIRDITSGTLDLSSMSLTILPRNFMNELVDLPVFSSLTTIILNNNQFTHIPVQLEQLNMVKVLQLHGNKLGDGNGRVEDCRYLENVASFDVSKNKLAMNQLEFLLDKLNRDKLTELVADNNPLICISSIINMFSFLKILRLSYCGLTSIHMIDFYQLSRLETLDVANNKLEDLGQSIYENAHRLQYLNVENNCLSEIAPEISLLPNLKVLLIVGNPQRGIRTNVIQQGSEAIIATLRKKLHDENGEIVSGPIQGSTARNIPTNSSNASAKATVFRNQNEWNSESSAGDRINQTKNAYAQGNLEPQRAPNGSKSLISYVSRDNSGVEADNNEVRSNGSRQQKSQTLKSLNAKKQAFVNNNEWNF